MLGIQWSGDVTVSNELWAATWAGVTAREVYNHVVCMEMYTYLIIYDADSEADVTRYIVMATLDSSYFIFTNIYKAHR